MSKKFQLLTLAALLCCLGAKAQLSSNPDKFLGNITTSYQVDYGKEKFYTLWNQITCENESKWASIEGNNNSFNFGGSDNAYNYAKSHNFPFKFHALIWGAQYPTWIESMTPEQRYKEIVQWMDKVKERYPNLQLIDVANECINGHQQGTKYFIEALGGAGTTGWDWLIKAFELAYERWPNAILIYNDFNTFQWNTDQYIDLVKTLRNAGAPIDAYGCQSHDLTNCSLSNFKSSMTKLQNALKMPMYSTEYDIGTTDDDLQLQRYKEQIPYMWESEYCAGITLWGYIYGKTWTNDGKDANGNTINAGHSGIIKNGVDRPAMTWLRQYMQSDAAKNAKSPFPGMVKEASVYVKPASIYVERDRETTITVRAKMRTKTIEKVELYAKGNLIATMTEAPYVATYTPAATGAHELKAVVTCTDGSKYERYSNITVSNPRTPFNNTPTELPGVLEAENFDMGAEGIAYHDNNSAKEGTGSSYRTDVTGADVEKGGTGYTLGYTQVGEWVEYTVNVKKAGLYAVNMNYSAPEDGAAYNLSLSTSEGLKSLTTDKVYVPKTSDWSKFTTAYTRTIIRLEEGTQVIRLTIAAGPNYVMNVDKIIFEQIDVDENIDVTLSTDPEEGMATIESIMKADVTAEHGVQSVSFYVNGILAKNVTAEPYEFGFTPPEIGTYKISAYATDKNGSVSEITTYNLKANPKRIYYNGIKVLPGIIEAEDFDGGDDNFTFHDSDAVDQGKAGYRTDNLGVDIVKINGGGYGIGYTKAGEWIDFTASVKEGGKYTFEAVVSSAVADSKFRIGYMQDGVFKILSTITVPQTGSGTFTTVTTKSRNSLPEGKQLIRFEITGDNCIIDKVNFICSDPSGIDETEVITPAFSNRRYSITGQQVDENYKGIVIKNGKKYVKK